MKLSIIVPVYNTEEYLRECIDSLVSQDWSDVEIICVNDGSTDHSAEILERFRRSDSRINVIHQENRGLSGARNSGLRAATGDYVCFVDSDDILMPSACRRLALECLGKDPDLIIFGAETMPASARENDPWTDATFSPPDMMCRDGDIATLLLQPSSRPFVWRNCIRRKFLQEYGLVFDEDVRYGEDMVFQMSMLPACRRVSFISDRLYLYRIARPGSLMESMISGQQLRAVLHMPIVEKIADFWKTRGLMERFGAVFKAWSLEFAAYDIARALEPLKSEFASRLMEIWAENGLQNSCLTNRGRVYLKMVEAASGKSPLPYCFLRVRQFAARLVAKLLPVHM